ncbi:hypothetical protein FOL46_002134 [Perkinsus olseni]|uniref:RAP domain-containing protein n=1 Tax=Perkinsus olseni TaxID=32597 RepID=A0A7J6M9S1_PEROL|nr:hypothetical protein FOL46_002134 [Perkinsus olseni]
MRPSRRLSAVARQKLRRQSDLRSRIVDADKHEFEEVCRELLSSGSALSADLLCAAGRAVASTKLSVVAETVDALCWASTERLCSAEEEIPSSEVVAALVSLASAGKPHRPSIRRLVEGLKARIPSVAPQMSLQEIHRTITALRNLKEPLGVEVQLLLDRLDRRLDMLSDFALASLARTIASSSWRIEAFAKSMAASWRQRVEGQRGLKSNVHAAVVFAVGKTADKDVITEVLRVANNSLDYSTFTFTELSQILWVYANNGGIIPSESIWKSLLGALSADGVGACATQTIGYAFWAAGVLSHDCHSSGLPLELIRQMAQVVVLGSVRGFQPSSVSYMVWAVSLAANQDCLWVGDFCKHLLADNSSRETIDKFKSLELANTLAAVCSLGLKDSLPEFVAAARQYFAAAAKIAPGTAANGRAFTQVAWTMVPEGGPEMEAIVDWFTTNSDEVGLRSLCRILWAASKCDGVVEACAGQQSSSVVLLVCAAARRFLDGRSERLEQQDVALLVWALGTLRLSHYELEERCCVLARGMLMDGRIDSRHLAMVLWGITSNSHRSQPAIDLIKDTVSAVERGGISFDVADVAVVLWAMAASDVYDQAVFRHLLSVLATGSGQLLAAERRASLSKVHRAYLWARLCHGFVHTPQETGLIAEALEEAQMSGIDAQGAFQTDVCRTLNRVLARWPSTGFQVMSEVDLGPELPGLVVDAALVDGRTGSRGLLVEVDGPHHYVSVLGASGVSGRQYNGQSVLKHELIRKAGFRLLCVGDEKWRSMDRADRFEFIRHEVSDAFNSRELFPG